MSRNKLTVLDVEEIHRRTLNVLSALISNLAAPEITVVVLTFGEPEVSVRPRVKTDSGKPLQHSRWHISVQMDWLQKVYAAGLAVVEGNLVLWAAPSVKAEDVWIANMLIPMEQNGIKAAKLQPVYVVRALDQLCWAKNYEMALSRCQECFANRLVEGSAEAMDPGVCNGTQNQEPNRRRKGKV